MPTQIDQIPLNSSAPGNSYKNLTNANYSSFIDDAAALTRGHTASSITNGEKALWEALQREQANAFHAIMLDDQNTCHDLEDQPFYKNAIYPKFRAPNRQLTKQEINDENIRRLTEQNHRVNNVLGQYQAQFDASLRRLQDQQTVELREFNTRLNAYTEQLAAANTDLPIQAFAERRRNEFLAYQQRQLNDLKQLYEERQQNFLNRVQNAPRDLNYLRRLHQYDEQKAVAALLEPSTHGNALNDTVQKELDKKWQYVSIPWSLPTINPTGNPPVRWQDRAKVAAAYEQLQHPDQYAKFHKEHGKITDQNKFADAFQKEFGWHPFKASEVPSLKYSIEYKGEGSQTTAQLHFDTNVPNHVRLNAIKTSFDSLLALEKNHFNLRKIKYGFKRPERYDYVLKMARHIWEQNPDAIVNPGWLPGKDPNPNGTNHTGKYLEFINLRDQAKQNNAEQNNTIQQDYRFNNGFPADQPQPNGLALNVPTLTRPNNRVEPIDAPPLADDVLNNDRNRNRIAFGPPRNQPANNAVNNVPDGNAPGDGEQPIVRIGRN